MARQVYKSQKFSLGFKKSAGSTAKKEQHQPEKTADQKAAIDKEVCHILNGKFRCGNGAAAASVGGATQDQINNDFALIEKYRDWVKKQTDKDVIKSYNGWLDFYAHGAAEAQKELVKRNKIASAARTVSVPKPNFK